MRAYLKQHRGLAVGGALALAAFVVFVLVWFQPQKLLLEDSVDEAVPTTRAPAGGASPGARAEAPDEPRVLVDGRFNGLEHATSGSASVLELTDGSRYLRFEDLETSNGPDLRVYLSEIPASDDWHAYGERFVDLGALKGNRGDQNYALPEGLDLSRYRSAVIWCRRFTVGFGVAPLDPV